MYGVVYYEGILGRSIVGRRKGKCKSFEMGFLGYVLEGVRRLVG